MIKFRHVVSVIVLLFVFTFGVTAAFALQTRKSGQTSGSTNTKASGLQTNQVQPSRQVSQPQLSSTRTQPNFSAWQQAPQPPFNKQYGAPGPGSSNFFTGQQPPQPPFNEQHGGPGPGSSNVCTDGTYLYVIQGSMIHQYAVLDLILVKTVALPQPELATTDTATSTTTATLPPPPHGVGPAAACTDGTSLYVLQGTQMLQYTLPDLTLAKTVALPQPEPVTTNAETSTTTATTTATLPPPPHGGPSSICTNASSLYVLQGSMMLQYTLPGLTLVTTVELPKPEALSTTTSTQE